MTRRDKIRNEHIRGTTRVVQASKKITEKRLNWYGHVRRKKVEHIVRRMLDVDIPGKRRRGRPSLRWKDACKRDMTQAGLKEDNATNRALWRKKLISYTGDPRGVIPVWRVLFDACEFDADQLGASHCDAMPVWRATVWRVFPVWRVSV